MILKRGEHYLMVIGFMAVIASVAPFQAAGELRKGDTLQALDVFRHIPTVSTLRLFENDLENQSVIAQAVRPWMQYLRFRFFRDTGEQALVGRRGWWFYRPDVRYLTERLRDNPSSNTGRHAAVSAIVSFRDQLAQRGIRLLAIPVPGKPAIYPDMLSRRAVPSDPRAHEHTRRLLADLTAAGVETLDLFETFAEARASSQASDTEDLYLIRDTHWTNSAASMAAEAVARRILSLGWALPGSVQYQMKPALVRRPGDILRMLQCPLIEALFQPEDVLCEQVVRADNGEPYRDDPQATILILGDSFLRIYERDDPGSAGFIAHLARHLQQPLASVVNDGGASTLVRQELARKPGLLARKKLVIWEFVERDIRFGMEGWQAVSLSEAISLQSEQSTTAPAGPSP